MAYVLKEPDDDVAEDEASWLSDLNREVARFIPETLQNRLRFALLESTIRYQNDSGEPHLYVLLHPAKGKSLRDFGLKSLREDNSEGKEIAFRLGYSFGRFHSMSLMNQDEHYSELRALNHLDPNPDNIFYDERTHRFTLIDNRLVSVERVFCCEDDWSGDLEIFAYHMNDTAFRAFILGYVSGYPASLQQKILLGTRDLLEKVEAKNNPEVKMKPRTTRMIEVLVDLFWVRGVLATLNW